MNMNVDETLLVALLRLDRLDFLRFLEKKSSVYVDGHYFRLLPEGSP